MSDKKKRKASDKAANAPEPRVSCRVTQELHQRIAKVAQSNGMDASDVVRMALLRVLPLYEKAAA